MDNIINLVIGDWSDDGHGKTHTVTVKSNLLKENIDRAYLEGVKKIGVDISEYCEDYEDTLVPMEALKKLETAGFDLYTLDGYGEDEEFGIWYEDFAKIWMFIAKTGNPDLILVPADPNSINIGGYGLFT